LSQALVARLLRHTQYDLRPHSKPLTLSKPCPTTSFKVAKVLYPSHKVRLYVLYGSHNKQRLFPYTEKNDWFFTTQTECVYCAVRIVPINTGRLIMLSMITNIYNKKTKGPTLMELFTATGKLKKIF
jgi:hypothetical protein